MKNFKTEPVIYIAGAVTGVKDYKNIFNRKRQELIESRILKNIIGDYGVICPHDFVADGTAWREAMAMCLNVVAECGYIYMLPGWEISKGARMEYKFAIEERLMIINYLIEPEFRGVA